jgi:hypothetical protein
LAEKRSGTVIQSTESQFAKFKEAAKQVETDDSEEAFARMLKPVAKAPAAPQPE